MTSSASIQVYKPLHVRPRVFSAVHLDPSPESNETIRLSFALDATLYLTGSPISKLAILKLERNPQNNCQKEIQHGRELGSTPPLLVRVS